jgi:hypothetical protein
MTLGDRPELVLEFSEEWTGRSEMKATVELHLGLNSDTRLADQGATCQMQETPNTCYGYFASSLGLGEQSRPNGISHDDDGAKIIVISRHGQSRTNAWHKA